MKKTALQQAIEQTREVQSSKMSGADQDYNRGLNRAIAIMKSLLPKEKESEKQIAQEAWASCLDYVTTPGSPDFEQYFTNTYWE